MSPTSARPATRARTPRAFWPVSDTSPRSKPPAASLRKNCARRSRYRPARNTAGLSRSKCGPCAVFFRTPTGNGANRNAARINAVKKKSAAPRKPAAERQPKSIPTVPDDPDYRRQVKADRAYKTPEERKAARENELRALLEQQDRQRG